jgi:hypothetical protein
MNAGLYIRRNARLIRQVALGFACVSWALSAAAQAQDLQAKKVSVDVTKLDASATEWKSAPAVPVVLMGQPMVAPRPDHTTTDKVTVQAVHDGTRVAFRVVWKDADKSEAGPLGAFSDALALQFPLKAGDVPPPVMMGAPGAPVHIFHWRAQYQRDAERGKPEVTDLYPNVSVDMYPMEFKQVQVGTAEQREKFSPGKAEGNPQSYIKTGVDEIVAEGFATSSVQAGHGSAGRAIWKDGEWTLMLTRPLAIDGGSTLVPGGKNFVAFAVWQGGQAEVGSRKSVTMSWTAMVLQ